MGDSGAEGPRQFADALAAGESQLAKATEQLVQRDAFGELLARMTENTMGLTRLWFDAADLVVRNLRLASRRDLTLLGRQLARTEDKLEMVLQEVERLEERLGERRPAGRPARSARGAARASDGGGPATPNGADAGPRRPARASGRGAGSSRAASRSGERGSRGPQAEGNGQARSGSGGPAGG